MGAQGTTTIDFGTFPGSSNATVFVSAPTILGSSLAEAWIFPVDTVDHSADEHMLEPFRVFAHSIVASSGFTISAFNANQINEPLGYDTGVKNRSTTLAGQALNPQGFQRPDFGGRGTTIYGTWTVAWVWN